MSKKQNENAAPEAAETKEKYCGIIMPIADMDGFRPGHWDDVRKILEDVIRSCNYKPRLVSDSVDTRVIHDNIVNNIYKDEIIVCDISGRNPNVMFELGMRLAFDKAVVVIKDHETPYAFDTGVLFQVAYPRDLRFTEIEVFKNNLRARILGTVEAIGKPDTKSFLDNFGTFNVEGLKDKDVPVGEYFNLLLQEIKALKSKINSDKAKAMSTPQDITSYSAKKQYLNSIPNILLKTSTFYLLSHFTRSEIFKLPVEQLASGLIKLYPEVYDGYKYEEIIELVKNVKENLNKDI